MKKKELEKIISLLGVITLSFTPSLSVNSETLSPSIQRSLVYEVIPKNDIVIDRYSVIKQIEEKGLELQKQREEEAQRLAIVEEQQRLAKIEEQRINEINRKNNVSINLDNVLLPSYMTAEELYNVLIFMEKPEMAELSWALKHAEELTSINMLFLAGLVANESGWNTSYKAQYQNNVTGYAAYNSYTDGAFFNSKYDCIIQTAQWLKNEYLSEDGRYFMGGYTTYHINLRYCLNEAGTEPDFQWKETINNISKTIESIYHQFIKEV